MIRVKEKKERALGERLQLKAHRCSSPKCAAIRRPYRPGVHGNSRRRRAISDFGRQLQEKQKFKLTYGVTERELRRIFDIAKRSSASTDTELMRLLERRIDNVVFRLGFAPSRRTARQRIVHGHIFVNGRRVKSPGYLVQIGEIIAIRPQSHSKKHIAITLEEFVKQRDIPLWLSVVTGAKEGTVISYPEGEALHTPFETSLLIESFSK